MNHLIATLPFILFSLVVIVLLTCSDPRRPRSLSALSLRLPCAPRS